MYKPHKKEKFLAQYGSYDHVDRMIGSCDELDHDIVHHVDLHKDHSDYLLKNHPSSWRIRGVLAENSPHQDHIDSLVKDNHQFVRNGLTWNKHLQDHHIHDLIFKPGSNQYEVYTAGKLIQHPNISKETLEKVKNSPPVKIREFSEHPHAIITLAGDVLKKRFPDSK